MSQELSRLTFRPFADRKNSKFAENDAFEVMFNPNTYTIAKSVTWGAPTGEKRGSASSNRHLNAPVIDFGGGGSRQLQFELFYDSTELSLPEWGMYADVRMETDKLVALTRIDRAIGRPRAVQLEWGGGSSNAVRKDLPMVGVVTSLSQRFSLFAPDGTPLRANLTVAVTEFIDPKKDRRKTDPESTIRVVKRGDSLMSIADEQYADPGRWRIIAEANGLDDPRRVPVGMTLTIPKVS
jgi:hypothetical protein